MSRRPNRRPDTWDGNRRDAAAFADVAMAVEAPRMLGLQALHTYTACMSSKQIQYTIRSIPAAADRALRQRARQEGKSLNQVVVEALLLGSGLAQPQLTFADLDPCIGTWQDDPEFDAATAALDVVDPNLWR